MSQIITVLLLNHRVISQGKLTGFVAVSGYRCDSYWV